MTFFKSLGELQNTWIILVVMVISGLSEGFSIALFVPIIELMGNNNTDSWILTALRDLFALVGMKVSLPTTLALISTLMLSAFALNYFQARLLISAYFGKSAELRATVFESTFRAGWGHLSTQAHGEVVNLLLLECQRYGQTLMFQVRIVATAVLLGIYVIVSLILSWQLLSLVMVLCGAFFFLLRPMLRRAKRLGDATSDANRNFNFHVVDFMRGAKLIKVTASEDVVAGRFDQFNQALFQVSFDTENMNELTYFILQSLPVCALASVIYFAHSVVELETAYILTFLLIMARMMPRLTQLQQFVQQYLMRKPAIPIIDTAIANSRAAEEITDGVLKPITELRDAIEIKDVSFQYPGSDGAALEKVNLKIGRHQMVALVGSSGSGKSTMVDLLAGLRRPDAGAVLIDGVDLLDIDLTSWRRKIGYVTQETTVFNDTARNNLLFANPQASEAEIADCLEAALLTDVIHGLPNGLDSMLGEGGIFLSGGERQRLALARALIGGPEFLLLDEATSALDSQSENVVQLAIEEIAQRMTVLVVAHRFSTVRKADVIYVIENGQIVETGSYTDLVAQGGRFAELHHMQFS